VLVLEWVVWRSFKKGVAGLHWASPLGLIIRPWPGPIHCRWSDPGGRPFLPGAGVGGGCRRTDFGATWSPNGNSGV